MQAEYANRIVERGTANPAELVPNPENYRTHPEVQQKHMDRVLGSIGWVEEVIVNRTTGHVVDGHLRVGLAIAKGEAEIPVAYVELTEREEHIALATLDTITAMAVRDDATLVGLLDDVGDGMGSVVDWMRNEGKATREPTQAQIDQASDDLQNRFRDDGGPQGVELQCPDCGEWFGVAGLGVTN